MANMLGLLENSYADGNEISVSAAVNARRHDFTSIHPPLIEGYGALIADTNAASAQLIYITNLHITTLKFYLTLELEGGRIIARNPGLVSSAISSASIRSCGICCIT